MTRIIITIFLLNSFFIGCAAVDATGDAVEAVGEGTGHIIHRTGDAVGEVGSAVGEGIGHAVTATGRAVSRGVNETEDEIRGRR